MVRIQTVQADEDAFKATQSADLKKQAQNKKIQEGYQPKSRAKRTTEDGEDEQQGMGQ